MNKDNLNKWHLFVISIGFLVIASSPMSDSPLYIVMIGAMIIIIGLLLMRRYKK